MNRPRFTVRLVMLAVLFVAIVLGAFEAGRRWEREHAPRTTYSISAVLRMIDAQPNGTVLLPPPPAGNPRPQPSR